MQGREASLHPAFFSRKGGTVTPRTRCGIPTRLRVRPERRVTGGALKVWPSNELLLHDSDSNLIFRAKILLRILAIQILNFLLNPTDALGQFVDLSEIITIGFDLELLVVVL